MRKAWLFVLLLFVLAACSAAEEQEQAMTLFEAGTYEGERLTPALPEEKREELEQIALTMQLALVQHQAWYDEQLSQLQEGEPLPYDERLGVSEEEYALLLAADDDLVPTTVGDTTVTVTEAKKQLKINSGKQTIIKDIAITNNGATLVTDIGELTYVEAVTASDTQAIGRWNGHHYRLGAADDAQTLHISLGVLESGQRLIHVEVLSEGHEKLEEFILF